MSAGVYNKRLVAAVAIVLGLVAAVPITGSVFEGASGSPVQAAADEGIRATEIVKAVGADAALSRMEELAASGKAQLPVYFEREIGLPDGARDTRVDSTGRVVGFLVDGPSHEVFVRMRESMARAGWSEVSLGETEGATFVKEGGLCSWALVTCTQVGSATSVVYRCVVR